MDLFKKTIIDKLNRKKENADKKPLFAELKHPKTAKFYQEEWDFISDEALRENIAYQMQYLEFKVLLYNEYQIYLTVESLMFKDVVVTVGGIVEAALFDQIADARKKAGLEMDRTDFTALLGAAYHEYKIIDKDLWHFCHELRKTRNLVHLKAADFQEHIAYTIDEANDSIKKLEEFRRFLKK